MDVTRLYRLVAAVVAVGALLVPVTTAMADDPPQSVFGPLFHDQTGTYEYKGTAGGPHFFTIASSKLDNTLNHQALVGVFDTGTFAGFAFNHDYEFSDDTGAYQLQGMVDPAGLQPPVPILATVTADLDRSKAITQLTISGSIGGQPFSGTTGPIVNPLYAPLGG